VGRIKVKMEIVRHETCLEYFRRRLSEGWKCISLEGYHAVLLSPEGIRRELDLRNDVLTLRPNAAGDETNVPYQYPTSGSHWDKVDEASADNGATYVMSIANDYGRDLYALPNHTTESGDISSIIAYARCYISGGYLGTRTSFKICIKTDSVVTEDEQTINYGNWKTYSKTWAVNPADNQAWGWADIDAMQVGIALRWGAEVGINASHMDTECTQIYVEVNYTPVAAKTHSFGYIIG